jgi:hypothetical protein
LFEAFLKDWNTLLSSGTEASYHDLLKEMTTKHPPLAMSYCEGTWLNLWKEKLVGYWVNQNHHFGVTVTSPIEGCHATLKSYLQRGNGDLRGVFVRMQHFWDAQHTAFTITVAQQQLRPKTSLNRSLFADVLQHVHGYALQLILEERSKIPPLSTLLPRCDCTIQQSFGLPCYHRIWEREQNGGVILLDDIHRHCHYYRPIPNAPLSNDSSTSSSTIPQPILNPVRIRGKGRPRGAFGGVSRIAESSTRRYPSSFELPSSSAPPILEKSKASTGQLFVVPIGLKRPSPTARAMTLMKEGYNDP